MMLCTSWDLVRTEWVKLCQVFGMGLGTEWHSMSSIMFFKICSRYCVCASSLWFLIAAQSPIMCEHHIILIQESTSQVTDPLSTFIWDDRSGRYWIQTTMYFRNKIRWCMLLVHEFTEIQDGAFVSLDLLHCWRFINEDNLAFFFWVQFHKGKFMSHNSFTNGSPSLILIAASWVRYCYQLRELRLGGVKKTSQWQSQDSTQACGWSLCHTTSLRRSQRAWPVEWEFIFHYYQDWGLSPWAWNLGEKGQNLLADSPRATGRTWDRVRAQSVKEVTPGLELPRGMLGILA